MTTATLDLELLPTYRPGPSRLGAVLAVSALLHLGALAVLASREVPPRAVPQRPVELVMVEVARPAPPAPAPDVQPTPAKPAPIRTARAPRPPPPPTDAAPPPPNDTPAPAAKPAPLVVGISMSSTTSAGTFAAAVGNTLHGKTETKARAPETVRPQAALPRYTPIYQVDREPSVAHEQRIPYPPEARRANVEGTVTLALSIDTEGRVVTARVLAGPGHGLDEAALQAIRRFRFHPALRAGEPVSTEMKYQYTFVLD